MYYCVLYKVEVVQAQRPFHFSASLETVRRESERSLHYISVLLLFCSVFARSERAPAVNVLHLSGCWLTNDDRKD